MIEMKYAVEICRIISKTPEERLPMIVSILEEAGLTPQGLDEMREWSVKKNRSAVIDINDFMGKFEEKFKFHTHENEYRVPIVEFGDFCKSLGLDDKATRLYLVERNIIQTFTETAKDRQKTAYTTTVRINSKLTRVIVIKNNWKEHFKEDNNAITSETNEVISEDVDAFDKED